MDAQQLQQLLNALQQMVTNAAPQNAAPANLSNANLASSIDARISVFRYNPDVGNTFESWFKRYGKLIEDDGSSLPEASKVRLLLGKLGEEEYSKYRDTISPTQPDQVNWNDTISHLKQLFAETRSLFVRRYECFKIRQQPGQDVSSLIAQINASCENADLSLTKEQLKCIILVIALSDEHHDFRQKALKMLEDAQKNGTNISLKKIEEELRAIQLVKESALSLVNPPIATNAIRTRPRQWPDTAQRQSGGSNQRQTPNANSSGKPTRGQPTLPCGSCGKSDLWRSDCTFKGTTCFKCNKKGHISTICRSKKTKAPPNSHRSGHNYFIANMARVGRTGIDSIRHRCQKLQ